MSSKFAGILNQAKGRETEPVEAPPVKDVPIAPPPAPPADTPTLRRPGRPKGKRSNDGFEQVTAYIPLELHHKIKLALLQEQAGRKRGEKRREFSELVAELLAEWLTRRQFE